MKGNLMTQADEVELIESEDAPDQEQAQAAEAEDQSSEAAEQQTEADADDEVIISIGEESPPQEDEHKDAPSWVRELRKKNREDSRRIRELEEQLKAVKGGAEEKPAQLKAKPKLEDYDYDTEKYELELTSWYDQKRAFDEAKAKEKSQLEAAEKAWQQKLTDYQTAKSSLKVKDYEDAEMVAQDTLSTTQQGIILQGSENPALVIYALGKNPQKAKELAAINDPVKYAFAVAKLETQLKVSQRKAAPPPERTISGTGRVSGTVDSTLDRLRADAERTGDYTKVVQYRKQLKQKK